MKQVGVITFLHNDNYGSALQAYALQMQIRSMGYGCTHLNYAPDTKEKILNMLRSGNSPKLILEGLRKKQVKAGQTGARLKSACFGEFYKRRMDLTAPCNNRKALQKASREMDILVSGSDQIWSPVWLNPVYFLDFAGQAQKKVAYAPSLGVACLKDQNKGRKITGLVKAYSYISTREQEGADLIGKLTGRQVDVNPDPVCLIEKDEWLKIAEKPEKTGYILCYFIGESAQYWQQVKELQQKTGKEVLVLPVTEASYQSGYTLMDGASPEQFLGLVANADLVCTDSFHCTVFTTIFGRDLQVFRRYREDDPESKNSRIDQWMRLTKADNREETEKVIRRAAELGRDRLKKALES